MTELLAVFVGGVLGGAHCIGMCGGFAAAIGAAQPSFVPALARQLVYSAGRITTYAFLGAVCGFAGLYLSGLDLPLVRMQQVFSFIAGVTMLAVGASVLGLIRFKLGPPAAVAPIVSALFRPFFKMGGATGAYAAGVATGFLPCGLVYSFLALAIASGHLEHGLLLMVCFGLGTVPAMVAVGCGGNLLSMTVRRRTYQAAAVLILALGVVTIYRAMTVTQCAHCHST